MLVATAGHVDHGKTLLVRALTGVDTDRLPEEKQRGLTIDLGFAYLDVGEDRVIGFVDVPGHERFVRNMLAGVGAIDHALLIVAADDGPMPQTVEHLQILGLLGIEHGTVAITKIDAVEPERVEEVRTAVSNLLAGTSLEGAPIHPVSALDGTGMDGLRGILLEAERALAARSARGNFRLAVDRSFSVPGAGLVVTGTAFSGRLARGDHLLVMPDATEVRVRGVNRGHREVTSGEEGERLALNITGADLDRERVHRGCWLVSTALDRATDRIDATLDLLPSEPKALAHWTQVHFHVGATFVPARVAVLAGTRIGPGTRGRVQLVLERPTVVVGGDRYVIRDQSARRTMGGGRVLDPFPPARGRQRPERLNVLDVLADRDDATALARLLEAAPAGVDLDWFARARNLAPREMEALRSATPMVLADDRGTTRALSPGRWEAVGEAIVEAMRTWHETRPDLLGADEAALLKAARTGVSRPLAAIALRELIKHGRIARDGTSLRHPDHQLRLSGQDQKVWESILRHVGPDELKPPVVTELAQRVSMSKPALEAFLKRCVARRQLVRVVANRYFHPRAVARLGLIAEELAAGSQSGRFDARTYRDHSKIGRNLTIQVLEFLDVAGLTRRIGDERLVVASASELFGRPDEVG